MITAKEARGLVAAYNSYQSRIAKSMELIEKLIKEAAAKGQTNTYWTGENDAVQSVEEYQVPDAAPTAFQQLVMAELLEDGYAVDFGPKFDSYVPRGLMDYSGEGPLYVNLYVTISWDDEGPL